MASNILLNFMKMSQLTEADTCKHLVLHGVKTIGHEVKEGYLQEYGLWTCNTVNNKLCKQGYWYV